MGENNVVRSLVICTSQRSNVGSNDVREEETDLYVILRGEMKNAYWILISNLRKREKLEVWHNIKVDVKRRACEEVGGPCEH